jgi:excisionase family DNA binding protein
MKDATKMPPQPNDTGPLTSDRGDIMTAREAAEYLQMNQRTLYRLAQARKIPYRRPSGHYRFRRSELDEWLKRTEGVTVNEAVEAMAEEPKRRGRRRGRRAKG